MSTPGLDAAVRVSRRDWWSDGAYRAVDLLVQSGRPFTADDIRELVGEAHEAHLMGAVLAGAQRSKQIETVGATIGRDGRPTRLWRAVVQETSVGGGSAS